ncbi:MAG: 4'-phosphopantetheinyl transferase superfamily protein [Paludibacteraceae bacterium]|nr:4'-phosphopantetheinyl transferase superfamily protein [Paludibacteraceae bacterium]MBN2787175.1 4'-phosphopantetheinyl transferase superfamily protein [Paludibacteraceae bacterium]
MLFQLTILPNGAKLGIWKMEEKEEQLKSLLCEESITDNRFQSIKNEVRKLEWLCTRVLLKELCGEEKKICYNEWGKPNLEDNSFKISISHTKNYVAVMIHPSLELGIDIEKKSDRVLKLKEKFMSDNELKNINPHHQVLHVLLHWSAKESLFKILPETEFDFIQHLHIQAFNLAEKGSFDAYETRSRKKQNFTMHYEILDDFVLTWTTK